MHTQRFNDFRVATNWKLVSIFVTAAVSFTTAQAQIESPNQWLNEQMRAAKLDRTTPRDASGVATARTAVKPDTVARVGARTGAPAVQSEDKPQSITNAAGKSLSTQK